ncbi:MAG: glycosyltransferase [Proteobacteria bacterium]|nr:glycosyltransferase [Pseudomonadota bacterium]
MVQSGRWTNIVWDGLHPMSVLISEGTGNQKKSFAPKNHFYRAHNCESEIWRQYQGNAAPFLRPFLISETTRMLKLERRSVAFAGATLCINESDAKLLKTLVTDAQNILTLPVELPLASPRLQKSRMTETQQQKQQQQEQSQSKQDSPLRLLWMGGLDWWPNRQGLAWFFENVWPKLAAVRKDIHVSLTGRGTQKIKMKSGAGSERVSAHGFVEDPLQLLRDAHILIVPVFFGSGIRIKALEALINGVPCIGTTAGLSGISEDGCWISDSAEEWCTVLSSISVNECADKGATGKAAVRQRHSPHMTDQIMDLFFAAPETHRAG